MCRGEIFHVQSLGEGGSRTDIFEIPKLQVEGNLHARKHLDTFIRFDRTPTCDDYNDDR